MHDPLAPLAIACDTRQPVLLVTGWDGDAARLLARHRRGPCQRRWLVPLDQRASAATILAHLGPAAGELQPGGWEAAWRTWGWAWSLAPLDGRPSPPPPFPPSLPPDPVLAEGVPRRNDPAALLVLGRWLRWRGRSAHRWPDPGHIPPLPAPAAPRRAPPSINGRSRTWELLRQAIAITGRAMAPPGPAVDLLTTECHAWLTAEGLPLPVCDEPWEAAIALGELLPWLDLPAIAAWTALLHLAGGDGDILAHRLQEELPPGLRCPNPLPAGDAPPLLHACAAALRLSQGGGLADALAAARLPAAALAIAAQAPRLGPRAATALASVLPPSDACTAALAAGLGLDPANLGPAWLAAAGPATALALAGRHLDADPTGALALADGIPPLDPCRDQALVLATAALLRLGRPAEAAERALAIRDLSRRGGPLTQSRLAAGDAAGAAGALDGIADQEVFLRLGADIAERLVHSGDRAGLGAMAALAARRRSQDPRIDRFANTLAALAIHLGSVP